MLGAVQKRHATFDLAGGGEAIPHQLGDRHAALASPQVVIVVATIELFDVAVFFAETRIQIDTRQITGARFLDVMSRRTHGGRRAGHLWVGGERLVDRVLEGYRRKRHRNQRRATKRQHADGEARPAGCAQSGTRRLAKQGFLLHRYQPSSIHVRKTVGLAVSMGERVHLLSLQVMRT